MTARPCFRTLARGAALAALFATVAPEAQTVAPFLIKPDSVAAAQPFDLNLLSMRFDCGVVYSHHGASVAGNRITLSFLATENPNAVCPSVAMPYGPAFAVQGLPAGFYDVYAYRLESCMIPSAPGGIVCALAVIPEYVGVLSAGVARPAWFLPSREVRAGVDFTLSLRNNAYGNCNTSFEAPTLEQRDGALYASFVIRPQPQNVCVTDIRPHGPSIDAKGLPEGSYPVYVGVRTCRLEGPEGCVGEPTAPRWALADTLLVSRDGPTGLAPSRVRPAAPKIVPWGTVDGYRPDGRKAPDSPARP